MAGTIDLNNLDNYANQPVPQYIQKDNTGGNPVTDAGATLGRVLFYDKNLSSNNTISCASCHKQEFAFSDTALVSTGVNGVTGRHSMRLINSRFADETRFFWDERADSLEMQTTMPIQDHNEMGYSGTNGDPDLNDLLDKLNQVPYYNDLFYLVFGDTLVTEDRMQKAIAQFIRSIQSFDSKFDAGRAQAPNDLAPFPNYTTDENAGKQLFITPPVFDPNGSRIGGGAGCGGCHRAPEFDIDPNSLSNGIVFAAGTSPPNPTFDTVITRAPTLRDMVNPQGVLNGPLMHNGVFGNLFGAIQHYNVLPTPQNPAIVQIIDPRLRPGGNFQQLNLTPQEISQISDFLLTLTGSNVYTDPKWSDPFDAQGNITILNSPLSVYEGQAVDISIYPNPASDDLNFNCEKLVMQADLYNASGQLVQSELPYSTRFTMDVSSLPQGIYLLYVTLDDVRDPVARKVMIR
jgi:cytochrome c peroxidase